MEDAIATIKKFQLELFLTWLKILDELFSRCKQIFRSPIGTWKFHSPRQKIIR